MMKNNNLNCSLVRKMQETVARHELIKCGDKIIVGVSGGADSVSLLRALHALRNDYNLNLIVCHVNHKIRPGAAERDQAFVDSLCRELGVECHVKEAHVEALAKEWNMSDEEAGRKVRYDFFNEIAGSNGKIATAHNKNDNAETVMMRFMRGTGLHGLTGIPYRRDNIIRPLLDISRDEIETYLEEIGQKHITDETNLEPIYTRNKVRLNLIPEIQKEFNPNFVETLANNIANYSDEDDYMNQCAEKALRHYFTIGDNDIKLYRNILDWEHVAVAKRAFRMAIVKAFNVELPSNAVNGIIELLNKPIGTKMTVSDGIVASVQYSGIVINRSSSEKKMNEYEIAGGLEDLGGCVNVDDMTIMYNLSDAHNVINSELVFYCPIEVYNHGLILRTRRDGDVVRIAPGMRKKLKKLFVDKKVDVSKRDNYWMFVNKDNEIVWIPGLFGSRLEENERSGKFVRFVVM